MDFNVTLNVDGEIFVSKDGMAFRKATLNEIERIRIRRTMDEKKRDEESKNEFPDYVTDSMSNLILHLKSDVDKYEAIFVSIDALEKTYKGKDFGRLTLMEVIGYLEDEISTLEKLIEKEK